MKIETTIEKIQNLELNLTQSEDQRLKDLLKSNAESSILKMQVEETKEKAWKSEEESKHLRAEICNLKTELEDLAISRETDELRQRLSRQLEHYFSA